MLRLSLFSPHARPLLLAVASPEPEGGALPHTVNSLSQGALTASTAPGAVFTSEAERRAHFKSAWHADNLQRRLEGRPMRTRGDYESALLGEDDDQDAWSDEEDEEGEEGVEEHGALVSLPLAHDGARLTLYRRLLLCDVLAGPELARACSALASLTRTAIMLCSGGRFAGALFRGESVTLSKTHVCYTTRCKQGGAQSKKDAQHGHGGPKSAGSNLRRAQEKKFRELVAATVAAWRAELAACERIFVAAPGSNLALLRHVGLERTERVPFSTRRPTLDEVQRVHARLFAVMEERT